jgi:hypothetical protein
MHYCGYRMQVLWLHTAERRILQSGKHVCHATFDNFLRVLQMLYSKNESFDTGLLHSLHSCYKLSSKHSSANIHGFLEILK